MWRKWLYALMRSTELELTINVGLKDVAVEIQANNPMQSAILLEG